MKLLNNKYVKYEGKSVHGNFVKELDVAVPLSLGCSGF